ncbi:MAG: ABC transporter permease subunit, partial [Thermomicrobiales bacterium]
MAIQSAAPSEKTLAARRPATFRSVSKRLLGSDWAVAYIFIAPMLLLLFGLIGYPLFLAVKMSMHNFIGGLYDRGFVGLHNYSRLWGDDGYRESVAITIRFAVISVFCKFWLGIAAALLLNRKSTKFRSVFTGLIMLPWIIPEVVAAFAWRGLYNANLGGLNQLLQAFGIIDHNIDWVGEPKRALAAIVAVNVWKGIPFFTIILLAGMKSIDLELYDAAAVDGANGWQRFLNITLPGLRYVIIVACLLSLISTLNSFGLVYLLTGGSNGTKIFSIYTFESINQLRYGVASASALALSPLLVLLIILLGRYIRADFAMQSDNDEAIVRRGRIFTGVSVGVLIALLLTAAEKVGILVISNDVLMFLAIILAVVLALLSGYFLGFNAAIGMGRFAGAFFDIVFWPFLKVFQAFLWVLDLIGMVVDKTIGAVVGGIRRAITGGNTRRETGFHRVSSGLSNTIAHLLILVLVVFELFPFYWMTITAFKSDEQFRSFRSLFWPDP